jgi:hypothetical protein
MRDEQLPLGIRDLVVGKLLTRCWAAQGGLICHFDNGIELTVRPVPPGHLYIATDEAGGVSELDRLYPQDRRTRALAGRRLIGLDGDVLEFSGGVGASISMDGRRWCSK